MSLADKKTSEQWLKELYPSTEVIDPDGWDRLSFQFSWYEELITKDEFRYRLMMSTVRTKKLISQNKDKEVRKPAYIDEYVRVTNSSPLSRSATISIGNIAIPFYEATITLNADSFATIEIRTRLEGLDIVALQEQTTVVIEQPEEPEYKALGEV